MGRIIVLEKGVERKELAGTGCCAVAPAGKLPK